MIGGIVTPERLTVPTCIGCGAMSRFGTCESDCSERRLDLVRAAAYDSLAAIEETACARIDVLLPVVEELISGRPSSGEWEEAYRAMQTRAREALRSAGTVEGPKVDVREPAEAATTWWCARCGGIDAPQPCLGICVWREVEWVEGTVYERRRKHVIAVLESDSCVADLLRRLAWATPRQGHWEHSWAALQAEAREVIQASPSGAEARSSPGGGTG